MESALQIEILPEYYRGVASLSSLSQSSRLGPRTYFKMAIKVPNLILSLGCCRSIVLEQPPGQCFSDSNDHPLRTTVLAKPRSSVQLQATKKHKLRMPSRVQVHLEVPVQACRAEVLVFLCHTAPALRGSVHLNKRLRPTTTLVGVNKVQTVC